MIHTHRIQIIVGSVRPRRIGPQIATWVAGICNDTFSIVPEILDLKDWPLPLDDEPGIPAVGEPYVHAHTRRWSEKIAAGDAFIFVTPQYNWGYPAALKNALDHLYLEWRTKPAMIVTYGGHGGGKCAEQLRQVIEAMKMRPVATMPALKLPREHIEANTGEIDPATQFVAYLDALRQGCVELGAALAEPLQR